MAVAFMPWMMWPAREMNLISSAVHLLLENTTVLPMKLWEFNAVSASAWND